MDASATLRTFASNFEGLQFTLVIVCAFCGLYLVASSIWKLATWQRRERAGESPAAGIYSGLAGGILLSLGEIVRTQTETFFGNTDPRSILDYANPSGNEAQMLATVLIAMITFFGWIGIATGWFIFARLGRASADQRSQDIKNMFVFLGSGTIASNPVVFSDVVCATFGWENYLRQVLGQ